jgi:hypothetical protein
MWHEQQHRPASVVLSIMIEFLAVVSLCTVQNMTCHLDNSSSLGLAYGLSVSSLYCGHAAERAMVAIQPSCLQQVSNWKRCSCILGLTVTLPLVLI